MAEEKNEAPMGAGMGDTAREAIVDVFFSTAPALSSKAAIVSSLQEFVNRHRRSSEQSGPGRPVVCVTSGGTTVPLEKRCVRFIDNFSAGTRGAASTEYFLAAGYAVVFLHRRFSVQPFCRHLPHPVLDCLDASSGTPQVVSEYADQVQHAVSQHQKALEEGTLLSIPFTTLFDYLQLLRLVAEELQPLGRRAMLYLAAAVSDFYMPWPKLEEHKIQSAEGPLTLELAQVPKMIPRLRTQWAPQAFTVSFKLETDPQLLMKKARGALDKYSVHAVVANELHTRKFRVEVVSKEGVTVIQRGEYDDVESPLIAYLAERHKTYIREAL